MGDGRDRDADYWASLGFSSVPEIVFYPMPERDPVDHSAFLRSLHSPAVLAAAEKCRAGDEDALLTIQQLVAGGQEPNHLGLCLDCAVEAGNEPLVQEMLAMGVPFSAPNITSAIKQQAVGMLSLFKAHGWDVNSFTAYDLPPPLANALCPPLKESVVMWFLDNGADPDAKCQIDRTPLSLGVELAPLHVVKLLFDRSPAPQHGQLLHCAARRKDDDCVAVLDLVFQHFQPDINAIQYHNDSWSYGMMRFVGLGTALHVVAERGKPESIGWLLDHGADLNIRNSDGLTPLQSARRYEHLPAIEFLERHLKEEAAATGTSVDELDLHMYTPSPPRWGRLEDGTFYSIP